MDWDFSGVFDLGSVLVVLFLGVLNFVGFESFLIGFEVGFVEFGGGFEVELSFLSWVLMTLVLFFTVETAESNGNLIDSACLLAAPDFNLIDSVRFFGKLVADLTDLVWFLAEFDSGLINLVRFSVEIEVGFLLLTMGKSSKSVSSNNLLVILNSLLRD